MDEVKIGDILVATSLNTVYRKGTPVKITNIDNNGMYIIDDCWANTKESLENNYKKPPA